MGLHSERTKGVLRTGSRWVFPLLKQANVLVGIQPEGIILARSWCVGPSACLCIHAQNIAVRSLTGAFTLLVTLRPRLVTWGRCHRTQERVANVGCVELPLPSCALAVHSVPTTAATNVDCVVNGFVQNIVARQRR